MSDRMMRIITRDGTMRGVAAETGELVEECRRRQGTDPTATVALGRLATGAALMGGLLKGDQRLALIVEGNGPMGKINAETDARGAVRASVKNPISEVPPAAGGFDVPGAVGRAGFLHVIKDLGMKEPYRSMVQLQSSEIAEDLAYYLTTSEQVPSSVALGVYLEQGGRVGCAGGFMVQAMPPGNEADMTALEDRLLKMPPPTELLRQGLGAPDILQEIFGNTPFDIVSDTPVHFACRCSRRQIANVLISLGREEVAQLIEDGGAQVTCEFCNEIYAFSREELESFSA
ncbi:MAG: Hsp33 family molecular chaperone HslO [Desulfuromonadales bacterium]